MKTAKKALTVILSVILWIIILLAALYAFTTLATRDSQNVSSVAGFTPLSVESDSMSPTFNAGDLIIIRRCDTSALQVGDIITFHTLIENQYALNTHRIAEIEEVYGLRSYTTKGDNNAIADTRFVSDNDIVGKYVTKLPHMGTVMDFLSSSTGFLIVIVLPMLLFFIYQVYHIIVVSINLKKAIAAEATAEQEQPSADAVLAEAERARAEAQKALEEARRLKAEAEAARASEAVSKSKNSEDDL